MADIPVAPGVLDDYCLHHALKLVNDRCAFCDIEKSRIMNTENEYAYDASRVANFGRDMGKAYGRFIKADERLSQEINSAIDSGVSPLKVAHDLFGRCIDHEERINLMSVIIAMAQTKKIPESVAEPFKKGITPRRV